MAFHVLNLKELFYAFPKVELKKQNDNHFVANLIKETGVVVVPGTGFGQVPGTSHFRVVFLPQDETLDAAYKNMISYYGKYKTEFDS